MSDIVFEDLPPRARGYTKHATTAAELRGKPGQWARVSQHATSDSARQNVYRIRNGLLVPYAPAGAYEAEWRRVKGQCLVYARYVGEGDQ